MIKSEFSCPECHGSGVMLCRCCDSELDCESCDGSKLDVDRIDVEAYEIACEAMRSSVDGNRRGQWDWIEGGKWLGRRTNVETVAIADFQKEPS